MPPYLEMMVSGEGGLFRQGAINAASEREGFETLDSYGPGVRDRIADMSERLVAAYRIAYGHTSEAERVQIEKEFASTAKERAKFAELVSYAAQTPNEELYPRNAQDVGWAGGLALRAATGAGRGSVTSSFQEMPSSLARGAASFVGWDDEVEGILKSASEAFYHDLLETPSTPFASDMLTAASGSSLKSGVARSKWAGQSADVLGNMASVILLAKGIGGAPGTSRMLPMSQSALRTYGWMSQTVPELQTSLENRGLGPTKSFLIALAGGYVSAKIEEATIPGKFGRFLEKKAPAALITGLAKKVGSRAGGKAAGWVAGYGTHLGVGILRESGQEALQQTVEAGAEYMGSQMTDNKMSLVDVWDQSLGAFVDSLQLMPAVLIGGDISMSAVNLARRNSGRPVTKEEVFESWRGELEKNSGDFEAPPALSRAGRPSGLEPESSCPETRWRLPH